MHGKQAAVDLFEKVNATPTEVEFWCSCLTDENTISYVLVVPASKALRRVELVEVQVCLAVFYILPFVSLGQKESDYRIVHV